MQTNFESRYDTLVGHAHNAKAIIKNDYPPSLYATLSLTDIERAIAEIPNWPGYAITPLHTLSTLSEYANVNNIFYKDESRRFTPVNSFKALGGAYAVFRLLAEKIVNATGITPDNKTLASGQYAEHTQNITVATATDGNHGRSVAWGAKMFGCQCQIYIHAEVSEERKKAMESLGACVTRVNGNYDESVRRADVDSRQRGWFVVSDTSYPGYTQMPQQVMAGYGMMVEESLQQLPQPITHVFLQGGCGGMAAGVIAWLWHRLGANCPRIIIVESTLADCLYQSARAGKMRAVNITQETIMAGLSCGEVSQLAWNILSIGANDFMTINDELIAPLMRELAYQTPPIEAGESAVAGLAGLLSAQPSLRNMMNINDDSNILVFGTEGATAPELYQQIISASPNINK